MSNNFKPTSEISSEQPAQNSLNDFQKGWIGNLLSVLDNCLESEIKANILRACAAFHYRDARMDEIVSQYCGSLEGVIQFLSEQWHWQVTYDPANRTIWADENKPYCVCPLVQQGLADVSGTLCHCSEGFAERMFSGVIGRPVEAKVSQSVLRGDPSCVYWIQM
jgi:hypothetical protein